MNIEIEVKGVKLNIILCQAGEFLMGSPQGEPGRFDDETQHSVIIEKDFWLSDTVCTQALWKAVMGNNPSNYKGDNLPVDSVSWNDVHEFLKKLNELLPGYNFRLPSEEEWEYACRAGTTTAYNLGDKITPEQVNYYSDSSNPGTVDVKKFPANKWGFYQMHGNVWEWCQNVYKHYVK
jgi:formylglycine-generating enzyme required for sulfatase activity